MVRGVIGLEYTVATQQNTWGIVQSSTLPPLHLTDFTAQCPASVNSRPMRNEMLRSKSGY